MFHAKIEGGKGRIFFFSLFVEAVTANGHIGSVGGRGNGNCGDFPIVKRKSMHPRWLIADVVEVQAMLAQLPTEEIFRAVFAVSTGENQGVETGMQGNLGDDVTQANIPHAKVGGIDRLPVTGFDNITDAHFLPSQKIQTLIDGFPRVVKPQVEVENCIEHWPQQAVATAITESDILCPELSKRETRRRQGADNDFTRPVGDEDRVGVTMVKNGFSS